MLYIMSTSILPNYGEYRYEPASLKQVQKMIHSSEWTSAVGHESTAEIISTLTGADVKQNRITVTLEKGDKAIVFKLNQRPPEGAILDKRTLEEIGFSWGLITRVG